LPFYFENDKQWEKINGSMAIKDCVGAKLIDVSVNESNPDEIEARIRNNMRVIAETETAILYPGDKKTITAENIFILDQARNMQKAIIYSKEPIQ
jgi:capsular polysaccharide biosynthesis protein